MSGKWADGIEPRNLRWVLPDRLAVSERPGGTGTNYRRVRRQEELLWLRNNEFDLIITLADSPVNLHSYDDIGLPWDHMPWPTDGVTLTYLREVHDRVTQGLIAGQRILVHKDDVDDDITSLVAAMLLMSKRAASGPKAAALTEQIVGQRLGVGGQRVVDMVLTFLDEPA